MAENVNGVPFRDIKSKRPWRRYLPQPAVVRPSYLTSNEPPYFSGENRFEVATQAEFLAEYYPSSHRINDERYYPNIWRTVAEKVIDETGEYAVDADGNYVVEEHIYCELVPRISFPFQQIIAFTHIYHATTNDIQHELAVPEPADDQVKLFDNMCARWIEAGMEEAWYHSYKSREITGDAAFVGVCDKDNKFHWRVFSFQKGDILYPQFDETGRLYMFARCTYQYDEFGSKTSEVLEVWDDVYYSVFRRNEGEERTVVDKIKGIFGLDGYKLVKMEHHGFMKIPVAYMRNDDGPGWSGSQDAIDDYELSFSQMKHNNQAYGEAILVTKTKGDMPVDITRGLNGTIKQIDMTDESDAHFLEGQSASESYMKQLDKEEEMIYRGSEIVKTPSDLKSGDTPATSIKLLFTPNLQRATSDLTECQPFIAEMWRIFASGYGRENNCVVAAESLPVISWGLAFVPQSESAIVADLVALVNAKIISAQTAAERCPFYSKPGEQNRVNTEEKQRRDADLLVEIEEIKASQAARNTNNKNSNQQKPNNEE